MKKSEGALRTISELAEELGVAQHILRYWETRFSQLRPLTRAGNRRYYRPEDVELARRIQRLLNVDGFTIKGAQQVLAGKMALPGDGAGTANTMSHGMAEFDDGTSSGRRGPQIAHGSDPAMGVMPAPARSPSRTAEMPGNGGDLLSSIDVPAASMPSLSPAVLTRLQAIGDRLRQAIDR